MVMEIRRGLRCQVGVSCIGQFLQGCINTAAARAMGAEHDRHVLWPCLAELAPLAGHGVKPLCGADNRRSEEHTSELQSH